MKLLVTGATGFVGSNVIETALNNNYEVIGTTMSGNTDNIRHLLNNENLRLENVNLIDFIKINQIVGDYSPDVILHIASVHPPKPLDTPYECFEPNVKGTLNLLEAARKNNITKLVHMSSMSVYGNAKYLPVDESHPTNPGNFYAASKLAAELYSKLYADIYGLNIIVFRCSGIYGQNRKWGAVTNFVQNILNGLPPKITSDISWDIVYIKDVANAFMRAVEIIDKNNFEIINIGSGTEVNIKMLVSMILDLTKSQIKPVFDITSSNTFRFYFNIEKSKRLLKFNPTPLENGLSEYITWMRKMYENTRS